MDCSFVWFALRRWSEALDLRDEHGESYRPSPHMFRHTYATGLVNRDVDLFDHLRDTLLPGLVDEARGRDNELRIWSAGCASGEEPYTIAVLLAAADARGTIDATDIDRLSLERTRQAKYPDSAFTEMPADLRRRYFRDGEPVPEVTVSVAWAQPVVSTDG